MEQAIKIFAEYAADFEKTYIDDDWSRLRQYFSADASYEVRGGPLACNISGREAIFVALKKSIDGLDRRCSDRQLAITDGPSVEATASGSEVRIAWDVIYTYRDAPQLTLPGRSVFAISGGEIVAMRDEYDEKQLGSVVDWMLEYGAGLDGSYV